MGARMRNGLLVAASFILVGSGVLRAQNYFPLAVGNRWEYIDEARERRVIVESPESTKLITRSGLTFGGWTAPNAHSE